MYYNKKEIRKRNSNDSTHSTSSLVNFAGNIEADSDRDQLPFDELKDLVRNLSFDNDVIDGSDHSDNSSNPCNLRLDQYTMPLKKAPLSDNPEEAMPLTQSTTTTTSLDDEESIPKAPTNVNNNQMNNLPSTPPPPPRPRAVYPQNTPSRADKSKLGRSVIRPVEEKPLLDEIREVLAQSYLMFLLADLRHMSATGRISTKYENLAIDSDVYKRDTAESIACCSDNDLPGRRGLSPAVIMAIVILEIRDSAVRTAEEKKKTHKDGKKRRYTEPTDIDNDDQFVGYENNDVKKKLTEESMYSLMRCYSRMVSEDLVSEIPNIQRRRHIQSSVFGMSTSGILTPSERGHLSSQTSSSGSEGTNALSNIFNRRGSTSGVPFPSPLAARIKRHISAPLTNSKTSHLSSVEEEDMGFEMQAVDSLADNVTTSTLQEGQSSQPLSPPLITPADSKESSLITPTQPSQPSLFGGNHTHPSFREQLQKTAESTKNFADQFKKDFDHQMDNLNNLLPANHEANTRKEFKELTDVFFDQGQANDEIKKELGATYSRKEMVDLMRKAVEDRNEDALKFLGKMFKNGTISKLMAESHARIVWVNDWYPMKDLTYAISVDTLQRRVMVVFRGAITTTDWKTCLKMRFATIRNPIKDDYEDKTDCLRVFSGLHAYLFRKRKDTGTTKYEEIAYMAHKYGMERIGPDYKLFVTGHSLGGALTHFFAFYASTDERLTKNGPVKAISFANPYMGGHSWADAFRHQERVKKLQLVCCRNSSDVIPRIPANLRFGRRGPLWRHVGIGVTLPKLPIFGFKWKPFVHYWGKEKSWWQSMTHGFQRNIIFHFPYLRPWSVDRFHTLFELQDRLMYGELNSEGKGGFALLQHTLDELYEKLEENDFETFNKTKRWGLHRKKSGNAITSEVSL